MINQPRILIKNQNMYKIATKFYCQAHALGLTVDTVLSSSSDQSESCLRFPLPIRKQNLALSTLSDSCKLRNLSV